MQRSKLARSSDPKTSHDAAAASAAFSGTHREKILAALKKYGKATPHEMQNSTGLTVVQIDRRLHELEKDGLACVVRIGGDVVVRDGARVWHVKEQSDD